MSTLDELLGALDEEPAIMIAVDGKTILNARTDLAELRAALGKLRAAFVEAQECMSLVTLEEVRIALIKSGYTLLAERVRYIANATAAWLKKYPKETP